VRRGRPASAVTTRPFNQADPLRAGGPSEEGRDDSRVSRFLALVFMTSAAAHRKLELATIPSVLESGTTWMQMICALLIFQTPDLLAPADLVAWLHRDQVP
jgi:hypothetical protein